MKREAENANIKICTILLQLGRSETVWFLTLTLAIKTACRSAREKTLCGTQQSRAIKKQPPEEIPLRKPFRFGGSNSVDLVNPSLKNNWVCLSCVYILLEILLDFKGRI